MKAHYLTVDGRDYEIERIEPEPMQRLRLVFTGPPPALHDRVIYVLTDGASREPVRHGWVECLHEVIVTQIY